MARFWVAPWWLGFALVLFLLGFNQFYFSDAIFFDDVKFSNSQVMSHSRFRNCENKKKDVLIRFQLNRWRMICRKWSSIRRQWRAQQMRTRLAKCTCPCTNSTRTETKLKANLTRTGCQVCILSLLFLLPNFHLTFALQFKRYFLCLHVILSTVKILKYRSFISNSFLSIVLIERLSSEQLNYVSRQNVIATFKCCRHFAV